ncbi:DUF4176 domain-containing protein [Halalkalibacterium halodurans]|nr:DUF4176 domain-containing protein [Halalkalibacterium halodurans]MED4164848.1 DUF4176 domain-containing protein [Halalkalibacterium halodurans]
MYVLLVGCTQKETSDTATEVGDELLPIGSVVITDIVEAEVMIYGRKQIRDDNEEVTYDYVAVPYPHGMISTDYNVFFYQDNIQEVIFKGYESDEEYEFREFLKEHFD